MSQIHPGLLLQNRYEVLQQIGRGGFSQTFDINDNEQNINKVIKVLCLDRFYNENGRQKAIELFQRESEILTRLQCTGIPRVESDGYFIYSQPGHPPLHCLVMEKVNGLNLEQWLENRGNQPAPQEQALDWLEQLCSILSQVHQEGLIHRDIKPSNIMLRPNGKLALIDFGGVRELTETYLRGTTGTMLSTPGYTPPEQMDGKASLQSDLFALGRTFIHLLTGKHPVDFDREPHTGNLIWRESAPDVSKLFAELIDNLVAIIPGRRIQKAQLVILRLADISYALSQAASNLNQPNNNSTDQSIKPLHNLSEVRKHELLRSLAPVLPIQPPLHVWKRATLYCTLNGHLNPVSSITMNPDSQFLASGSYDKTIKIWSLKTKELLHTLSGHSERVTCVAIHPNGKIIASSSYNRTIKLWSLLTGDLLQTLTGHASKVYYAAFSPDGTTLISSSSLGTNIWAVRTGKLLRTLTSAQSDGVRIVSFSPDGRTCIIGSLDGTLELWNPHIGKFLCALSGQDGGVTSIAFSKDGQLLASTIGRTLKLWNPLTGKFLQSFPTHSNGCFSVAFSPDGLTLASGGDRNIELWNPQSGKLISTLPGHTGSIRSIAFSSDGSILASGSHDKTIKLWKPVP